MSLFQIVLITSWAGYCSYDDQGPQMLRRPLLVGPLVGLILGDMQTALVVSATLELMWMGLGNMAGYQTPDMIVGTIVGTTLAITTGQGIATGVALATTVALLSQQFNLIVGFLRQFFFEWAAKIAKTGDFDKILQVNVVAIILQVLIRAIPTFIIIYFGAEIVEVLLAKIPTDILMGLTKASSILPAVGLSILMTIIMKSGMWGFLILGFVLNAYLQLDILAITLISIAFATLYMWIMESKGTTAVKAEVNESEEYDL